MCFILPVVETKATLLRKNGPKGAEGGPGPADGGPSKANFLERRYAEVRRTLSMRSSQNSFKANFRECPEDELLRIPLPRTRVNRGKRKGRHVICPGPPNTDTTLKPHDDETRQRMPLCLQKTAPWRSCRP